MPQTFFCHKKSNSSALIIPLTAIQKVRHTFQSHISRGSSLINDSVRCTHRDKNKKKNFEVYMPDLSYA